MADKNNMPVMPWNASDQEERRFRIIMIICLLIALLISLTVPFIKVPEVDRMEAEKIPPRLAKLILEKKKEEVPPPPPPPEPEPEPEPEKEPEKKPEPEKEPEPEPAPEPKPEPEPEKKPEPKRDVEAARKKAASAGVLAMSDMLADLRDAQPAQSLTSKKPLQSGGTAETAGVSKSLLLANASKGSGGINTNFSRDTGATTQLAGRQTTAVESSIDQIEAAIPEDDSGSKGTPGAGRTLAEITRVMNANYNGIYTIYQRALRKNPLLSGKIVFRITIAPSGDVTDCTVVSSELNDARLERKLALRIKRINFGAKDVPDFVVDFPYDLVPNS